MAQIDPLWPRWMESAGGMLGIQALVRSRCCQCETELRVELADLVARYGPAASLIDRLERCQVVGCTGSTYYSAARTYGQAFRPLLRDPELRAALAAPAIQAARA